MDGVRLFYVSDLKNATRRDAKGRLVASRIGINLNAITSVRFRAEDGWDVADISFGGIDRVVIAQSEWDDIIRVLSERT